MAAYLIKTYMCMIEFLARIFIFSRNLPDGWRVVKNIRYAPGPKRKMDVYMPAGHAGTCPVLIYIHGGGWTTGSKLTSKRQAVKTACEGYVVLNMNYRLGPAHKHPAQLEDMGRVLRWLNGNAQKYGGDPDKIFLAGGSAGAHLACLGACLATNSRLKEKIKIDFPLEGGRIAGLILLYGGYNMDTITDSGFFMIKTMMKSYTGYERPAESPIRDQISPIYHINENFPPVFVSVGGADPLYGQTIELIDVLKKKKVDFEQLLFDRKGRKERHAFINFHYRKNTKKAYRMIFAFMKKHS